MDGKDCKLSIRRQAELLGINRSSYYREPANEESEENLKIMRFMDEEYLEHPQSGVRTLVTLLKREGVVEQVNPKRVRRLRKRMGLQTLYRRPRTTIPGSADYRYPYLLRDLDITRPNQVWCTDITYIPMGRGFLYLTVMMDWYSRRILAWELSSSMDKALCLRVLAAALERTGTSPEIINSDQGSQYTSDQWVKAVRACGAKVSMDGKGCWVDNVMVERFWRTLKYDDVYLRAYADGHEARYYIGKFIDYYNRRRPHQSHDQLSPNMVYAKPMAA